MRRDREPEELSPAAASLLHGWLASRPPPEPSVVAQAASGPDAQTMVRYLTGSLPEAQAADCARQLVSSSSNRQRLREALTMLDRLTELPRAAVVSMAAEQPATFQGEVAAAWLELTTQRVRVMPRLSQQLLRVPWSEFLRELRARASQLETAQEAQAARVALWSLGRMLQSSLNQPRIAWARGTEPGAPDLSDGRLREADVTSAVATSDGSLEVAATLREDAALVSTGGELYLYLALGGTEWPLGRSSLAGGSVRFNLEGIGSGLGLAPGAIPTEYFAVSSRPPSAVSYSDPAPSANLLIRPPLLHGEIATVIVQRELHCDGAALTFTASATPEDRQMLRDYELTLFLRVAPEFCQRIGSWPLAEFDAAGRVCSVPCPGCSPGPVPLGVALTLEVTRAAAVDGDDLQEAH